SWPRAGLPAYSSPLKALPHKCSNETLRKLGTACRRALRCDNTCSQLATCGVDRERTTPRRSDRVARLSSFATLSATRFHRAGFSLAATRGRHCRMKGRDGPDSRSPDREGKG